MVTTSPAQPEVADVSEIEAEPSISSDPTPDSGSEHSRSDGPRRTLRLLALIAAPGLLVLGILGWFVVVPSIERDLTTQSLADIQNAGISTETLTVEFSYRNGLVTGTLPSGVTPQELADALDVPGARLIRVRVAEPEPVTEEVQNPLTSGTELPVVDAALGDLDMRATVGANGVILTGVVQSDAQRDALVLAARQRFGPTVVTDDLQAPAAAATDDTGSPEAEQAVLAMVDLIAQMPAGLEGAATVGVTEEEIALSFSGVADSDANADALRVAVQSVWESAGATGETTVSVPPPPPPTPDEIAAVVQEDLNGLNASFQAIDRFRIDSFDLSEDFKAALNAVPPLVQENPEILIEIVGHTDDRGRDAFNAELSEKRAGAVQEYLVEIGIDPARLLVRGAGEAEPIATNNSLEGRIANRRVELTAVPVSAPVPEQEG